MSDTDTTQMAPRPSALGDLGLAGTIAAGLVAGTLGLGALAAPLVGWKDWTSGLEQSAKVETIKMASPSGHTRAVGGGRLGVSSTRRRPLETASPDRRGGIQDRRRRCQKAK